MLIDKIANYIKSIFNHQKRLNKGNSLKGNTKEMDNFMDYLQKGAKNQMYKTQILDEVEKNPNIIDSLTYPRLIQLNKIYEERINELRREIGQRNMN